MSRSTWITLLAIVPAALLVLAISGCDRVFGLDEIHTCETGDAPNAYECVCDCPDFVNAARFPLLTGEDDAEELISNKDVIVTGQILDLGDAAGDHVGPQLVGIRFPSVGIPQGSTIDSAFVQFTTSQPSSVTSSFEIRGEASDDAAPFTTAIGNVSDRATQERATTAAVSWPSLPWTTVNEAGPAQLTPDLNSIVQEIVSRAGWASGHAMALTIKGTVTGSRRLAKSWDGDALRAPVLTVRYKRSTPVSFPLLVCMPDTLNPNNVHPTPTADQLATDCSDRVGKTVSHMASACGYTDACTCTATPSSSKSVCGCNDTCTAVPLDLNPQTLCSNFNPSVEPPVTDATNHPDDEEVCTAHSPLAAAMFGKRSQCNVTGQATITVDGESPDGDAPPTASGVVEFIGRPCPGGSCAIGMSHILSLSNVTFSNFWGSTTLTDLAAVGGSLGPAASLDSSGAGTFPPNSTLNTGRGRRGDDARALVAYNDDVIGVGVDWTPGTATCSVNGALVGTVDPGTKRCENAGPKANITCTSDENCATDPDSDAACSDGVCSCLSIESADMNLAVALEGPIVNQPPTANSGADQPAVECNIAGGARVMLDGSASSDADGNIARERWFLGNRSGPAVGFALKSVVEQALNTQVSYVLRVIDAFGQADEDTTVAKVVDTTAPVISCNVPATIRPPTAPVPFTATAVDICDPQVTPTLSNPSCFFFNKTGKKVYRDERGGCIVTLQGDTVTISDSGGVDDYITWDAQVGDDSGNTSIVTCQVHIVKP
jgi:hypothetical protein